METTFQFELPVSADTTKSCEIEFEGESLEEFLGYNLVTDPIDADKGSLVV